MRIPTLASAVLGLFVAMAMLAACLPEKVPAAGRGHELTPLPSASPGPFPAPESNIKPASRQVEPAKPSAMTLPGCRSIEERVQSVEKAAPDAAIYRHWAGPPALDYLDTFNRDHGTAVQADEVAIVVSASWGDRAIVLFEHDGCEAGTEQITFSVPAVPDDEQ